MEYKHHIEVSETSWVIKLWAWAWDANPRHADLCKLFWGYVFMVPVLFLHLFFIQPLRLILNGIDRWKRAHPRHRTPVPVAEMTAEPEEEQGDSRLVKLLEKIGWLAAKVAMGFQTIAYHLTRHKRLNRVLQALAVSVWGLTLLAAIGAILYIAVKYFSVTVIILAGALVLAIVVGIVAILDHFDVGKRMNDKIFRPTGRGAKGFGRVMLEGAKAVKSNTCPEIVVRPGDRQRNLD